MSIIPQNIIYELKKGDIKIILENPLVIIEKIENLPELNNPVFLEGLPGIGYVGYTTTSYIVETLNPTLFLRIYLDILPAQVSIKEGGLVDLMSYRFYYYKGTDRDFIFMLGEAQPNDPKDQYLATRIVLELLKEMGVNDIITVGGYGRGTQPEEPKVYGAATHEGLVNEFSKYNIIFSNTEPEGGIIGMTGLFLGLGKLMGFRGICLMGETSGMFKDPKAARAIIKILDEHFKLNLNMERLNKMVEDFERFVSLVSQVSKATEKPTPRQRELEERFRYIR